MTSVFLLQKMKAHVNRVFLLLLYPVEGFAEYYFAIR